MSKPLPPASVVIPTWNAAAFVARVLECLVRQEGIDFEIVVLDNGVVNDETERVVRRFAESFPRLRYLAFPKQLGYAGAVNEGAAAAAHDLVAVINNDNLPDPRWLRELVLKYESERAAGREAVVSSLVHRPDFSQPLQHQLNFTGRIVRPPAVAAGAPLFHPDGSAFLFHRGALGCPYDFDYFIYHEDVAIGWRAWLMGFSVVLAEESKADTFDGGSTRRIAYRTAFYTERNRWLNVLTFASAGTLVRWLPLLWIDAVLRLLAGSNRRAKLHAWLGLALRPRWIWRKRQAIQALRRRPDREILPLLSATYCSPHEPAAALLNPFFRGLAKGLGLNFGP